MKPEKAAKYIAHPYLPYIRNRNTIGMTKNGTYKINNHGFVSTKPTQVNLPPGITRIICIGGSTTEMVKGDPDNHYPAFLQKFLGDKYDVINAGVAGWTTAEMLINFELRLLHFKPKAIVIYAGINDAETGQFDNFKVDYSHARAPLGYTWNKKKDLLHNIRPEGAKKVYKRVPDASINTFKRNIESMVAIARFNLITPIIVEMNLNKKNTYDKYFIDAVHRNIESIKGLVHNYVKVKDMTPDDFIDGCHLDITGMKKIARDVCCEVKKVFESN